MDELQTHISSTESCAQDAQNPHTAAQSVQVEILPEAIAHPAPYSSRELALDLGVAESTLRTRWLPWINRVAPTELLVTDAGYTELARTLFSDFATVSSKKKDREQWVVDAKQRYSREFMPHGVTPEGISDELGGALALLRNQGNALQTEADAQILELRALIEEQSQVEAEFDDAEIEAMRAAGMKRGAMRYQIESEAEEQAYYGLKKLRSQARQGSKNVGKS
ncbi:MAG: hypothetical protein F6K42_05220 [Leptolyngbya sp. SIO1D8]|nr:hypothetical protein [Leptolyngbya sp. SIO1D8]